MVPIFMKDTIYGAHSMFTAAVTPPVLMAILFGITWKRYTPVAAFVTIVGGAILIGLSFVWPDALVGPFDFGMGQDSYKFMRALFGLLACERRRHEMGNCLGKQHVALRETTSLFAQGG